MEDALRMLGQGFDKADLQKLFVKLDSDGSGTIEFGEFLQVKRRNIFHVDNWQLMRMFYPEKRREFVRNFYEPAKKFPQFSKEDIDVFVMAFRYITAISNFFREFDIDGSDSIDADELYDLLRAMGQGVSIEEADAIVEIVDIDDSGEVEFNEFLQVF